MRSRGRGHKGDNGFHKHWCFTQEQEEEGSEKARGGSKADPPPLPRPVCQGRWPTTVAKARVLTLLIQCLPMPLTPVPNGSQSDNMTHDYQGRKQAARRLHGCHTDGRAVLTRDRLLPSQTAPPCMEGERRGAPGTGAPCLLLPCPALPSETALLYYLHSAGGQCTVPSAPTALLPSLLPASSLSWLLAAPHPHSPQGPAQLSLRRATDAQG